MTEQQDFEWPAMTDEEKEAAKLRVLPGMLAMLAAKTLDAEVTKISLEMGKGGYDAEAVWNKFQDALEAFEKSMGRAAEEITTRCFLDWNCTTSGTTFDRERFVRHMRVRRRDRKDRERREGFTPAARLRASHS